MLGRRVPLIVEPRIEEEQFQGSWKGPVRLPANLHVLCGSGDPQRSYDQVPREILWEVLGVYRVRGSLLRAIQSPYTHSESCIQFLCSKSNLFPVGVGLHQGCALSPILFVICMDRILRGSCGGEGGTVRWAEIES